MQNFLAKTFGGLTRQYYFRQLFFAVVISFFTIGQAISRDGMSLAAVGMTMFMVLNTFLYPYSRFVYESVIGFIMGSNVFYINAVVMMIAKIFTMLICYMFAIFIAPIGLLYLYFYHSRQST